MSLTGVRSARARFGAACRIAQAVVIAIPVCVAGSASAGLFGNSDEAKPADKSTDPSMVDSPWFSLAWPKVEMPKWNWKPSWPGGGDGMTAEKNPVSRALDRVSDTSKQAATRVRGAWSAAVEKLSFSGDESQTRTAQSDQQPGFFSRMFGTTPEPEPKSNNPVSNFLAQERPGTVR